MKACRHLDYDEKKYGEQCELKTLSNFSVPVRFWKRLVVPDENAVVNVQFCGKGHGRINGIFQCYNEGERPCYEPAGEGGD